jgi:hypothetical protein
VDEVLKRMAHSNPRWRYLFRSLPAGKQFDLFYRLLKGPLPTSDDWQNTFRPVDYEFARSWHFFAVVGIVLVVFAAALFQIFDVLSHASPLLSWATAPVWGTIAILGLAGYVVWREGLMADPPELVLLIIGGPIFVPRIVRRFRTGRLDVSALATLSFVVQSPALIYFASLATRRLLPWLYVALLGAVFAGIVVWLWRRGRRRDRAARNPLSGILKTPDSAVIGSASTNPAAVT